MARTRFWTDLTWTELHAADLGGAIAVLPFAAVEQHGPHLPLGTDVQIMDLYLRRVAERLPHELVAYFLPTQSIGASAEHGDFPGTLSLSPSTAIQAWTEIAQCVSRAGVRKLVMISSHGGNTGLLESVARDLRARLGLFCVVASWRRFGYPDGLFDAPELTHGVHAGDVETSLMLAADPERVRMEAIDTFSPASLELEETYTWLRATPPIAFAWMAQDLHELGAMGDASAATAGKGEAAADYGATAFIELLQDVEAFDLARLAPGPLT
jgi:creatinine amidohydrolase